MVDVQRAIDKALALQIRTQKAGISRSTDESLGATADVFEIEPKQRSAARVTLYVLPGAWIAISIGENTSLEIRLVNAGDGDEELLVQILQAVAAGRFVENVWIRGGEIVKSKARLELESKILTLRKRKPWSFWAPARRRTIAYSEY